MWVSLWIDVASVPVCQSLQCMCGSSIVPRLLNGNSIVSCSPVGLCSQKGGLDAVVFRLIPESLSAAGAKCWWIWITLLIEVVSLPSPRRVSLCVMLATLSRTGTAPYGLGLDAARNVRAASLPRKASADEERLNGQSVRGAFRRAIR